MPYLSKLKVLNKKKSLFFKRRPDIKVLSSKRMYIALRKLKRAKKRFKRRNQGRFFFKKFFYKTLLKSRVFLLKLYKFNSKTRQKRLTKTLKLESKFFNKPYSPCEYNTLNILLRSGFITSANEALRFITDNQILINGRALNNPAKILKLGDCIQLKISKKILRFLKFQKKLLKKKIKLHRYKGWKFFKKKVLQKQAMKKTKRKAPDYLYLLFLVRLNNPRLLEIDYLTLSIFIVSRSNKFEFKNYFFDKSLSHKFFKLYNYKKIT